jgi:flagellar L-ring protein precursor FlgH
MKLKSRRTTTALLMGLIAFTVSYGQSTKNAFGKSLFSDERAIREGDIITIVVYEISNASNDANTTTSRQSDLSFTGSAGVGDKSLGSATGTLGTGNKFKGEGATSARGSVTAKLSARVDTVYSNGTFWINGKRNITINGKEQIITVSGLVRPSDIQSDNSVYSYNLAEASIAFEGSGLVQQQQEPGWLTKFFHWLF